MKKWHLLTLLTLCLCLLPACGGAEAPAGPASQRTDAPGPAAPTGEDEAPAYLACRIVDEAEDGDLLLAALDSALPEGRGGAHDGQSVYRLSLTEGTAVYLDGEAADASALEDGMPVEIAFNGTVLEVFPAQLGEVYSVSGFSIGTRQNPGGGEYDLCGLYLQALNDLWHKDPALNADITMAGLDLSQAPGRLLESEKAALAWRFGELHGVEVLTGTFDELLEQGCFTARSLSAPEAGADSSQLWYEWPEGCLFSITSNENHAGEAYSLPTLFFNVEKWKSPRAAYSLYDCSAVWPEMGTWTEYQIGSEMIA